MKSADLIGQRFNNLIVVSREPSLNGKSRWKCKCDCGNITIVSGYNLKNNSVKSCGCLLHLPHNTHHLSKTAICKTWYKMRQRCYNKNDKAYKDYGGRGITICDEWNDSPESFYKWSIENGYSDGLSIDRIDNNKGYEPSNCVWSTPKQQANNRRTCIIFFHNGKKQNLMQWCEELNLPYKVIHSRIYKSGWSFEKAITTPIKSKT